MNRGRWLPIPRRVGFVLAIVMAAGLMFASQAGARFGGGGFRGGGFAGGGFGGGGFRGGGGGGGGFHFSGDGFGGGNFSRNGSWGHSFRDSSWQSAGKSAGYYGYHAQAPTCGAVGSIRYAQRCQQT